MSKRTIIAIIGESGTGKTSLSLYLNEHYGIPYVCSYTTRDKRIDEIDSVDHNFVKIEDMPSKEDMLAYTYFGGNHYWAEKNQIQDIPTTYVIDEKGIMDLKERHGSEFDIICIYIKRTNNPVDIKRRGRDKERITINESLYDLVIENNYSTKEEFCKNASEEIIKKFNIKYIQQ